MPLVDFEPAPGSRCQYVTRDVVGTVFLHMRPEAFSLNTAALFSTFKDMEFEDAYEWFQLANRGRGFCYL